MIATSPESRAGSRLSLFKRHENLTVTVIFVSFVIVIAVLQVIISGGRYPTFLSPVNLLNILQQVSVPGIVAVGMTMVMISGMIDLSIGSTVGLAGVIVALVCRQLTGVGIDLNVACIIGIAAAFIGLKGIHYVARVATYLPLIPLVILLILAGKTFAGVGNFKPALLTAGTTTAAPAAWEPDSRLSTGQDGFRRPRPVAPDTIS